MAESSAPGTSEHRVSLDGSINTSRRGNVPNLEGICVSAIAANFDRFSAAFKMRNSTISPNYIEFLARRFSEALFNIMKCDRTLKPEHFDFLINPHFKELDLVGIDVDLLPALSHKLKKGNNILSCGVKPLYHGGTRNDEDSYVLVMSSLRNVESIEYSGRASKRIFKAISNHCSLLKVFKLGNAKFDSMDKYDASVFRIMKRCPQLEMLQHPDTVGVLYKMYTTDRFFTRMMMKKTLKERRKYALKNLSSERGISCDYSLSDALKVCVILCPYVTSLHVSHLRDTKELESCLGFPHLNTVTFKQVSNITPECLNALLNYSNGGKLVSLEVPYISWLSMQDFVDNCPNLESATLHSVTSEEITLRAKELSCVARFPFLSTLQIEYVRYNKLENGELLKLILSPTTDVRKSRVKLCYSLVN